MAGVPLTGQGRVGLVNGVIVTAFRINALIATLAMSFVVSGLASLVTAGNLVRKPRRKWQRCQRVYHDIRRHD